MNTENEKKFDNMVETEKDKLWARAIGLTRKSEDAEDLVQDTVFKACKYWSSFDQETNFHAWVNRIMLNAHIDNVNRRNAKTECDFSTGECDNVIYHSAGIPDGLYASGPEAVFFNHHIDERLEEAIGALPDSYRVPFSLYHFEGCSYENISVMIDVPVGTVKSRIFRARKTLKEIYSKKALRTKNEYNWF